MGGAASIQSDQITVDMFRTAVGDKFYPEVFDFFKNGEGFISQTILQDLIYVNSRVPDLCGRAVAVYSKQ